MNRRGAVAVAAVMLTAMSCSERSEKAGKTAASAAAEATTAQETATNVVIDESTHLSEVFLDRLKGSGYPEMLRIVDDYVIVGNDTVYFPDDLALQKLHVFKATEAAKNYSLAVERINLTSIRFDFKMLEDGKVLSQESGQAELTPLFFLASETDEDDKTGDMYGASEYRKERQNCWLTIRIGIGKDDDGRLRASVNHGCHGSADKASANGSVTLRTEIDNT